MFKVNPLFGVIKILTILSWLWTFYEVALRFLEKDAINFFPLIVAIIGSISLVYYTTSKFNETSTAITKKIEEEFEDDNFFEL